MKRKSFIASDNIITSLGFTTEENFDNIRSGKTGIQQTHNTGLYPEPFPASLIDSDKLDSNSAKLKISEDYSRFEQLLILSISNAIADLDIDLSDSKVLVILSTTKGNIDLLKDNPKGFEGDRVHLWKSAEEVGRYFKTARVPLVISNACISGVLAIITADRLLKHGLYDHVVVAGCDVLSEFIVSGFQSFFSLSKEVCKPFDKDRTGLSLGEGAGTIVLTNDRNLCPDPVIEVINGSGSNDANHISGPSRTGEGLNIAIHEVLQGRTDVDYISAHGTATSYNDDMESVALFRNNLGDVPVNSFKAYIGHTLGAAGIIESIFCFESMRKNVLIKTHGCDNPGTVEKVNVILQNQEKELNEVLKTASGFGGSNTAVLFRKNNE